MKSKIFIGEFIGSCFLVMIIVGSGIMAENLTNDNALRLTANTLATGAGLFVLITAQGEAAFGSAPPERHGGRHGAEAVWHQGP
mgnify:CR=1 FL=1